MKDTKAQGPDFGERNRFSGMAILCFCSFHLAETFKHQQGSIWTREDSQVCHCLRLAVWSFLSSSGPIVPIGQTEGWATGSSRRTLNSTSPRL